MQEENLVNKEKKNWFVEVFVALLIAGFLYCFWYATMMIIQIFYWERLIIDKNVSLVVTIFYSLLFFLIYFSNKGFRKIILLIMLSIVVVPLLIFGSCVLVLNNGNF